MLKACVPSFVAYACEFHRGVRGVSAIDEGIDERGPLQL